MWVSPRLSSRAAFDAFARAIELDSAFAPGYEHIVDLSQKLSNPESARRYGEAYLRLEPARAAGLRAALDLMAHPKAPSQTTAAFLDTARLRSVWDTWYYIRSALDSGEAAIAAARAVTGSTHGLDSTALWVQPWTLANTLAYRGHIREAAREIWPNRSNGLWSIFTAHDLVGLGAISSDSAATWLESLFGEGGDWAWLGADLWAGRGDTASLARLGQLAMRKSRTSPAESWEAEYWTYFVAATQPFLSLARGDTTRALEQFASLPDSLCRYCPEARLVEVQLLSVRKQDRRAAALLDEPLLDSGFFLPTEVLWAMERGRVNERLGNRDKAVESYSFVTAVWRNADPELQPLVREAMAGLTRLNAELR